MKKQPARHLFLGLAIWLVLLPAATAQLPDRQRSQDPATFPSPAQQPEPVPSDEVGVSDLQSPAHTGTLEADRSSSTASNVAASNVAASNVALISDQTELEAITHILDDMSLGYDLINNNWDGSQGIYTSDYDFLSNYLVVLWYASGYGIGRLTTQMEHDALEQYLQAGGRLLVTGYDTLGSPTDPWLADLVRSSASGDGPFTFHHTITNGDHSIADGPFGTLPAGTALITPHQDHDQAEADTGRGATTVAESEGGRDKIIATELPSGGIVVYWNGNVNASDWLEDPWALEEFGQAAEPKPDLEGQVSGILTIDDLRQEAQQLAPDAIPPEANYGGSDPVWIVPRQALPQPQIERSPQDAQSVLFPASGDTVVVASGSNFWNTGDYAEGTRTLGLTSVSGLRYDWSTDSNILIDTGHVDLDLYINGTLVGSFSVLPGEMSKTVSFYFSAISGPIYTIRLEETNTVDPGRGSVHIPLDTSWLTFYKPTTAKHVALLKNTLYWMMHTPLHKLPFADDVESGPNGWIASGLWHQVQDGLSPYPNSFSPTHSWWYGQDSTGDYDTGTANSGNLTSPPVWIPSGVQADLTFWHWYETEPKWLPQRVYFDRYHDTDGDDNISGGVYTEWANMLRSSGNTVHEYNQPISPASLNWYQVLALFDPEVPLQPAEIAAINGFMQAGGRVVALGETADSGGVNTVLNALSEAHGITFNSDIVEDATNNDGQPDWPLISNFARRPPLWEVGTAALFAGCSLTLSGPAEPLATGDDDTSASAAVADVGEEAGEDGSGFPELLEPRHVVPGAPVVIARAPVGDGELITIGDSTMWTNEDPDNDGILSLYEYGNSMLAIRAFGKPENDPTWDTMRVQVSDDGAPYVNLLQVAGGPMRTWQPVTIDLSPLAGSIVRLRFRFDSRDAELNTFRGWYIDDIVLRGPRIFLPLVLRRP